MGDSGCDPKSRIYGYGGGVRSGASGVFIKIQSSWCQLCVL